jgi:hypothetical protein
VAERIMADSFLHEFTKPCLRSGAPTALTTHGAEDAPASFSPPLKEPLELDSRLAFLHHDPAEATFSLRSNASGLILSLVNPAHNGKETIKSSVIHAVAFYRKFNECLRLRFGTLFAKSSVVVDYSPIKFSINRTSKWLVAPLFGIPCTEMTNKFKLFRREAIVGAASILSNYCNITVELPFKAIVRGYDYAVLPNNWDNRKSGLS